MRSLTISQPLLIMMVGLPGAGKSYFARQFSDTFGAPLVSYDRIRYELFTQPQYTADEQDIINRIAFNQAEELLKSKRTFICDGGYNVRAERSKLAQIAKKAGYGTLIIWIQTDPATCKARALKRNPRRADDQFNQSLTTEQYEKQARTLTAPSREEYVVISGKHTYSTQARVILKKLAGPREEQAEEAHKSAEKPARPILDPNSNRRRVTIR